MAGDVNTNNGKKGDPLIYSIYYYDVQQLPPTQIEVVINGKSYKMTAEENPDYSKPVKFTYHTLLTEAFNEYTFRASNGKRSRKIPEGDYRLPGPFVMKG
jgi:DNA modification methylase